MKPNTPTQSVTLGGEEQSFQSIAPIQLPPPPVYLVSPSSKKKSFWTLIGWFVPLIILKAIVIVFLIIVPEKCTEGFGLIMTTVACNASGSFILFSIVSYIASFIALVLAIIGVIRVLLFLLRKRKRSNASAKIISMEAVRPAGLPDKGINSDSESVKKDPYGTKL